MKYLISILLLILLSGCDDVCCSQEAKELQSFHNDENITLVDENTTVREVVSLDLNDTIHDKVTIDLSKFICKSGNKVYLKTDENNNTLIDYFLSEYIDYECETRFRDNGMISIKCEKGAEDA